MSYCTYNGLTRFHFLLYYAHPIATQEYKHRHINIDLSGGTGNQTDNTCVNQTKPTYLHHIEIVWPCKDTQQKVSQFFLGRCKLPGPPDLTSWAQGMDDNI